MRKLIVLMSLTGLILMFAGCKDDNKEQESTDVVAEVMEDIVGEVLSQDGHAEGVLEEVALEETLIVDDIVEELPLVMDIVPEDVEPVEEVIPAEEVMAEVSE